MLDHPLIERALAHAADRARTWKSTVVPNEAIPGIDFERVSSAASNIIELGNIDPSTLIESIEELLQELSVPVIDYNNLGKDAITARGIIADMAESLWQCHRISVAIYKFDPMEVEIPRTAIYEVELTSIRKDLRDTRDAVKNLRDELLDYRNRGVTSGVAIQIGPISIELDVIENALRGCMEYIKGKSDVAAYVLRNMLSQISRNTQEVYRSIRNAFGFKQSKMVSIALNIVQYTHNAYVKGLQIVAGAVKNHREQAIKKAAEDKERLLPHEIIKMVATNIIQNAQEVEKFRIAQVKKISLQGQLVGGLGSSLTFSIDGKKENGIEFYGVVAVSALPLDHFVSLLPLDKQEIETEVLKAMKILLGSTNTSL